MTFSISTVIIIAIIAPIAALILVGRVQVYRRHIAAKAAEALAASRRGAGELEDQIETQSEASFQAKAEPTPGLFLRHFTSPQRAYLHNQFASARFGFFFCAYILNVVISVGLLPQQVHQVAALNPSLQVWLSYTGQFNVAYFAAIMLTIFTAIFASTTLQTPVSAIFIRTRPLSHSFIFWARVTFALASLLAAILVAIFFSTVLLLLTYGPVWTQLPSVSGLLQPVLAPSLSMLITAALVFSAAILLAFISERLNFHANKAKFSLPAIGVFIGITIMHMERDIHARSAAQLFFLSPTHAAVAPYALSLVSIACSVALLFAAQHLCARFEV